MTSSDSVAAPQPLLFIGGIGRSGSTLIEKLLNEFAATFSVGETVHLWERGVRDHERCGCGAPFVACPHWSAVGETAFDGWAGVDVDRMIDLRWSVDRSRRLPQILAAHRTGRRSSDMQEYLDGMATVLRASASTAAARAGVEPTDITLLDSSKHLSTAALLALDPRLDVKVLHLLRDPRGVAHSWTKVVDRPETDGETMPTYSPARTAGRWITDNLGFEALAKVGVPTMTLRYEDVLADPEESLRAVAGFAGFGDASTPIDFLDGNAVHLRTPMHSIAGNPLRFGGDQLTLRHDTAWTTDMSDRNRRIVTAITGPVLARYGYPRSP